jgi:hypothetical protein
MNGPLCRMCNLLPEFAVRSAASGQLVGRVSFAEGSEQAAF